MLWQTFFSSEKVDFSHGECINGLSCFHDMWKPAKVVVSEITDNKRWLMVTLSSDHPPVIFRVIEEGWILSCDERSLTLMMRKETPASPMVTSHKLRFGVPQDFWMFVAAVAQGRVTAYAGCCPGAAQSLPGGYQAPQGSA